MAITPTDAVLLAVLLLSALIGVWRGLTYEVISVAGWVAAFVAAQVWGADVGAWLPLEGWAAGVRLVAGMALVFVAVVFAGALLAWLVQKLVASVGLRPVDRVLGGAFGVLRGLVLLLAGALLVGVMQWHTRPWWQESTGGVMLTATLHELRPLLPESVARHVP